MMKKVLLLLFILVSCQEEDITKSISGTEWIGSNESYHSSKKWLGDGSYTFTETTTVNEYTLKFTTGTTGTVKMVSVATTDGVASTPVNKNYSFTYDYDPEFMRGNIVYDYIDGSSYHIESTFEIRSGFLYDDHGMTGYIEYRKK